MMKNLDVNTLYFFHFFQKKNYTFVPQHLTPKSGYLNLSGWYRLVSRKLIGLHATQKKNNAVKKKILFVVLTILSNLKKKFITKWICVHFKEKKLVLYNAVQNGDREYEI